MLDSDLLTDHLALQKLTAKWAPPVEKSKFIYYFMGDTLVTMITWLRIG